MLHTRKMVFPPRIALGFAASQATVLSIELQEHYKLADN